ncbi:MAG: phospholipase D-like domain-containing protein [Acidobacteriota bacterium]
MRFKSAKHGGFQVFAVSGINTISFAIQASEAARKGLLGFAVERLDPKEKQRYFMPGFKVFPSVIPHPDEETQVSTFEHPVQSLVWDDFTAKPGRRYEYFFYPLRGQPKNLDRSAKPIPIHVKTEPLFGKLEHDVFFNRGVASSQAYARKFQNLPPDQLLPPKDQEALDWLSRDLDDAILKFIHQAKKGDGLLGCFYEFRYEPVALALKEAIDRGVDVRLILDGKVNATADSPSFPREDNKKMVAATKIPEDRIVWREARASNIQHNKFMVLEKGKTRKPTEVWTGSTNLSLGGIHGQTNVGHWVRNPDLAVRFDAYWHLLSTDPGGKKGEPTADVRRENTALLAAVEALGLVPPSVEGVLPGVTPVFSPRSQLAILDTYFALVDTAADLACITLAFGINKEFKEKLLAHDATSPITFLLLEKKDVPNPQSAEVFVAINASNNAYQAWGSFLREPVYQWTKETNAGLLGLNHHVSYVHSKFLLRDPLGADPIVVTGSANFSDASTKSNDENMLVIRGDLRVADIYFTEFNRIFNHYYFRSVVEATTNGGHPSDDGNLFLKEKPEEWLVKYQPGKLRQKRVDLYVKMQGFV